MNEKGNRAAASVGDERRNARGKQASGAND